MSAVIDLSQVKESITPTDFLTQLKNVNLTTDPGTLKQTEKQIGQEPVFNTHGKFIGLLPHNRSLTNHAEIMEPVFEAFDKQGTAIKITTNGITENEDMAYVEVVLDGDIQAPDGQKIYPMISLKSSVFGSPLTFEAGSYRFICANGAKVGNGMSSRKISAKAYSSFMKSSFYNQVQEDIQKVQDYLSQAYSEIGSETFSLDPTDSSQGLPQVLLSNRFAAGFKKKLLNNLEENGVIEINVPVVTASVVKALKGAIYAPSVPELPAWDVYNFGTSYSSHDLHTLSGKLYFQNEWANYFLKS